MTLSFPVAKAKKHYHQFMEKKITLSIYFPMLDVSIKFSTGIWKLSITLGVVYLDFKF